MNIFLVHHRSPHHATKSGYGRLAGFMDGRVVYGNLKFPYKIAKLLASFHSQSLGIYNTGSILKAVELQQLLAKKKSEHNIVHFLNGERDIRHLGYFKRKYPNTKFCATFHKPPEVLKVSIGNPAALRKLDGAICVGNNQVNFITEWLGLKNVLYIPHGVDTQFFSPTEKEKEGKKILFVGQHLRDFTMLNTTLPAILEREPKIIVDAVLHKQYASKIISHPRVQIHSNINDMNLREFYRNAQLLFLPLKNTTACNSILEAMACGLPIVTSNVGGINEYLQNTNNIICPPQAEDIFIEQTIAILQDDEKLIQMGTASYNKAQEYEWKTIAQRVKKFYDSLN